MNFTPESIANKHGYTLVRRLRGQTYLLRPMAVGGKHAILKMAPTEHEIRILQESRDYDTYKNTFNLPVIQIKGANPLDYIILGYIEGQDGKDLLRSAPDFLQILQYMAKIATEYQMMISKFIPLSWKDRIIAKNQFILTRAISWAKPVMKEGLVSHSRIVDLVWNLIQLPTQVVHGDVILEHIIYQEGSGDWYLLDPQREVRPGKSWDHVRSILQALLYAPDPKEFWHQTALPHLQDLMYSFGEEVSTLSAFQALGILGKDILVNHHTPEYSGIREILIQIIKDSW